MDCKSVLYLFFLLCQIFQLSSGQFYKSTPHPQYSLQNMPKTSFSCRDKILGGYYADAETQCQMFHVCVKIAGVGVQDYRFLCPNGTAFDQEAQICGYFGDIDCQGSTKYYGSDNFDLYRIGSTFESKRAPFTEEAEAEFHLQRAETADVRRSKHIIVNQNSKINDNQNSRYRNSDNLTPSTTNTPAPIITTTTTTVRYTAKQRPTPFDEYTSATPRLFSNFNSNSYYNDNNNNNNNKNANTDSTKKQFNTEKPLIRVPATIAQYNNYNDEILRGSHSSDFFSNKNSGKENFDEPDVRKSLTTKKPTQTKQIRLRARQQIKYINSVTSSAKPFLLYQQLNSTDQNNSETPKQTVNGQSKNYVIFNKVNSSQSGSFEKRRKPIQAQPIQASQINSGLYSLSENDGTTDLNLNQYTPITSTTRLPFFQQHSNQPQPIQIAIRNQIQKNTTLTEHFNINTNYQNNQRFNGTSSRNSVSNKFYNLAYEEKANEQPNIDFTRKNNQPSEFQSRNSNNNNNNLKSNRRTSINEQYVQTTPYNPYSIAQTATTGVTQNSSPGIYQENSSTLILPTISIIPLINKNPTAYNRPHNNSNAQKKFSTLVPKDFYNPTTFRPNIYQKQATFKSYAGFTAAIQAEHYEAVSISTTIKPPSSTKRLPNRKLSAEAAINTGTRQDRFEQTTAPFSVTPIVVRQNQYLPSTTPKRKEEDDEDDGSYRPEEYEKDFYRNKVKNYVSRNRGNIKNNFQYENEKSENGNLRVSATSSDEDLKTANSLNIAASANELRKTERKQTATTSESEKANYSLKLSAVAKYLPTMSPNVVTTKKPPTKASSDDYNYEYYDIDDLYSSNDNQFIQEFAKTDKKRT